MSLTFKFSCDLCKKEKEYLLSEYNLMQHENELIEIEDNNTICLCGKCNNKALKGDLSYELLCLIGNNIK